jgi:hypothetical protein
MVAANLAIRVLGKAMEGSGGPQRVSRASTPRMKYLLGCACLILGCGDVTYVLELGTRNRSWGETFKQIVFLVDLVKCQ